MADAPRLARWLLFVSFLFITLIGPRGFCHASNHFEDGMGVSEAHGAVAGDGLESHPFSTSQAQGKSRISPRRLLHADFRAPEHGGLLPKASPRTFQSFAILRRMRLHEHRGTEVGNPSWRGTEEAGIGPRVNRKRYRPQMAGVEGDEGGVLENLDDGLSKRRSLGALSEDVKELNEKLARLKGRRLQAAEADDVEDEVPEEKKGSEEGNGGASGEPKEGEKGQEEGDDVEDAEDQKEEHSGEPGRGQDGGAQGSSLVEEAEDGEATRGMESAEQGEGQDGEGKGELTVGKGDLEGKSSQESPVRNLGDVKGATDEVQEGRVALETAGPGSGMEKSLTLGTEAEGNALAAAGEAAGKPSSEADEQGTAAEEEGKDEAAADGKVVENGTAEAESEDAAADAEAEEKAVAEQGADSNEAGTGTGKGEGGGSAAAEGENGGTDVAKEGAEEAGEGSAEVAKEEASGKEEEPPGTEAVEDAAAKGAAAQEGALEKGAAEQGGLEEGVEEKGGAQEGMVEKDAGTSGADAVEAEGAAGATKGPAQGGEEGRAAREQGSNKEEEELQVEGAKEEKGSYRLGPGSHGGEDTATGGSKTLSVGRTVGEGNVAGDGQGESAEAERQEQMEDERDLKEEEGTLGGGKGEGAGDDGPKSVGQQVDGPRQVVEGQRSLDGDDAEPEETAEDRQSGEDKGTAGAAMLAQELQENTVKALYEDSSNSGVAEESVLANDGQGALEGDASGGALPALLTAEEKRVLADQGKEEMVSLSPEEQLELEKSIHEDEETHASFMSSLYGVPSRISPTLLGVKDKTSKLILPKLRSLAKSTRQKFSHTSKKLAQRFQPFMGQRLSPLVATLLSYSLLLLPLLLLLHLFHRVRIVFSVRKILLLANVYLAIYCFGLLAASVIISAEPMLSLRLAAEPNFYVLQIVQATGYLLYMLLQVIHLLAAAQGRDRTVQFPLIKATLQFLVSSIIGLHYYITVFEPAMLDHVPHTKANSYAFYCVAFIVLTILCRANKTLEKRI